MSITVEEAGRRAKEASRVISCLQSSEKDRALEAIASALIENSGTILEANEIDIKNGSEKGLSKAMLDRLKLSPERINGMADAVRSVISLPDPVGTVLDGKTLPNGLKLYKTRVPLGVVAIIYEARPNVTADAASLCLKSGNCVILKGGKEAINSNIAIASVMRAALESTAVPPDCVQLIEDTSRAAASELMTLNGYIDVLIPRGGAGLIKAVVKNATVPVIETGAGNCHTYVDKYADVDMAANIVFNAKTSRPSVCNACETVIVHRDIAEKALPAIKRRLDEKNVELRGDDYARSILPDIKPAAPEDWETEYLDYILAVKTVDSIDEAIAHIARYSTGHSECIVTGNYEMAQKFVSEVDSAAVYVNASTRFTDGGEFGFGAEIGISTQKLHARGPMGLPELTSMKYTVYGSGQIR